MSYPDLGCYAECLTCEVCEEGLDPPDEPPDLFPDEWPDDADPFDLGDWAPSDPPDKPFDFDLPDIMPMNPFEGIGVTISGEF
jgi:hypothetical protein